MAPRSFIAAAISGVSKASKAAAWAREGFAAAGAAAGATARAAAGAAAGDAARARGLQPADRTDVAGDGPARKRRGMGTSMHSPASGSGSTGMSTLAGGGKLESGAIAGSCMPSTMAGMTGVTGGSCMALTMAGSAGVSCTASTIAGVAATAAPSNLSGAAVGGVGGLLGDNAAACETKGFVPLGQSTCHTNGGGVDERAAGVSGGANCGAARGDGAAPSTTISTPWSWTTTPGSGALAEAMSSQRTSGVAREGFLLRAAMWALILSRSESISAESLSWLGLRSRGMKRSSQLPSSLADGRRLAGWGCSLLLPLLMPLLLAPSAAAAEDARGPFLVFRDDGDEAALAAAALHFFTVAAAIAAEPGLSPRAGGAIACGGPAPGSARFIASRHECSTSACACAAELTGGGGGVLTGVETRDGILRWVRAGGPPCMCCGMPPERGRFAEVAAGMLRCTSGASRPNPKCGRFGQCHVALCPRYCSFLRLVPEHA